MTDTRQIQPLTVTFSDNIGSTPAKVNRETGEIFLNSNVWNDLPRPYQVFILEHEKGHYNLQTTNELEADHYAFEQIAGTFKESLKNTVRVLFGVLPYTSPMHGLRLLNMYRLALVFDYKKKPTPERLQEMRDVEAEILKDFSNNSEFMDYVFSKQKSGQMAKYEFPGYDQNGFDPSTGRWFRDFRLNQETQPVPWPTQDNTTPVAKPASVVAAVPIEAVPDFDLGFISIDLKTVVFCFLVLIIVSLLNKA